MKLYFASGGGMNLDRGSSSILLLMLVAIAIACKAV